MAKYRKKPVVIDAVQWTNEHSKDFSERHGLDPETFDPVFDTLDIPTLEGVMKMRRGDWLITGVKGEKYPCKPDIFDATYDRVDE